MNKDAMILDIQIEQRGVYMFNIAHKGSYKTGVVCKLSCVTLINNLIVFDMIKRRGKL